MDKPLVLIAGKKAEICVKWHTLLAEQFAVIEKCPVSLEELEIELFNKSDIVVLLDIELLSPNGVKAIHNLQNKYPNNHIVVFTHEPDEREEISAILYGARGYLSDDIEANLLNRVVERVSLGEVWVDRKFVSRLITEITGVSRGQIEDLNSAFDENLAKLTPRELEIAHMVSTGASNKRIADQLCIAERTVKAHLGGIFRKLSVHDRLQLALFMNRSISLLSLSGWEQEE